MNERLKELYSDSAIYAFDQRFIPGPVRELQEVITEKFAELIIKECANVCLEQRDPTNLNYKPSERFAEAVKQHFGIKE